ncbi:MAG TPA: sulfatase [Spirochaetota bacterium]|nr:sulfatase [Spirochaetota bacterium]
MNILHIDIDTLRPDHLGCYGYHRNTSPNIDRVAAAGVRMENCYAPDTPCLPSRCSMHTGRFGFHTGGVNHGGMYADPYREGPSRTFQTSAEKQQWVTTLRDAGYYTGSVSTFAGRHSAWWFLANYYEVYDHQTGGSEIAGDVTHKALDFLERNKDRDKWYLHFNIWDPHTPYNAPADFGDPFADQPISDWVTREMIDRQQQKFGTHCAVNPLHQPWHNKPGPRECSEIKNITDYTKWINGYDTGIAYADREVGRLFKKLKELGLYEDTIIIINSDHGENQGELNVYGDHQTADLITSRIPMIIKYPGVKPGVNQGLHYHFDITATLNDLLGIPVPREWDGVSFKEKMLQEKKSSRDYLVLSHGTWSCQRSVVFDDYILIKTYHDGLKELPALMLFNRKTDPHEQNNLADSRPETVNKGLALLQTWYDEQMSRSEHKEDPIMKVIEEGGPYHTRGSLAPMIQYYKDKGRDDLAEKMKKRYKGKEQYY